MTDRGIEQPAPLVRALLEGRRTQARFPADSPLRDCKPGDRLWVMEDHAPAPPYGYRFPATDAVNDLRRIWPAEAMPIWLSRLTLVIEEVRFHSLLDITDEDAVAEGCAAGRLDDGFGPRDLGDGWTIESPGTFCTAAGAFLMLWQELHPDWDGYNSPDVVALTFRVERCNIGDLPCGAA